MVASQLGLNQLLLDMPILAVVGEEASPAVEVVVVVNREEGVASLVAEEVVVAGERVRRRWWWQEVNSATLCPYWACRRIHRGRSDYTIYILCITYMPHLSY